MNYKNTVPSRLKRTGYFFKGFLMCILNPTLLIPLDCGDQRQQARSISIQFPTVRSKIAVMFLTISDRAVRT